MKNVIYEYLELTVEEKAKLWQSAVFVFDTNVFLNLYRYTKKTRDQLMQAFADLQERVWMPNHVAKEFMKRRYEVVFESNNRYDKLNKNAESFINECTNQLRIGKTDAEVSELSQYISNWINKIKEQNQTVQNPSDDNILERLLEIFDGKAGQGFNESEIEKIKKEGEKRYSLGIPPGYKDKKKEREGNANEYGDLIIWKEILDYSTKNKKDIIFVTNDQKEDWWNIVNGKTIGPRVELRKEFHDTSNQIFHMYEMSAFITIFTDKYGQPVDKEIIDEIDLFSRVLHNQATKHELSKYYGSFDTIDEAYAAQKRFNIMRMENSNRKRLNNIEFLQRRYPPEKRPKHIQLQIESTIRNYEKALHEIRSLERSLNE